MLIGLNARCLLAMSRVIEPFDKTKSEDLLFDAYEAARSDGYTFGPQTSNVPAMFVGEEDLVSGWFSGSSTAIELAEMWECAGCNNAHGNPCYTHG